jgi:hypothetical protein
MANMSYCRFHNTLMDLEDCYEHLDDKLENLDDENEDDEYTISEIEAKNRTKLIALCKRIAEEFES